MTLLANTTQTTLPPSLKSAFGQHHPLPMTANSAAPVDGVAVLFFEPADLQATIVFVDAGLSKLVGRKESELIGQSPIVLFHNACGETALIDLEDFVLEAERQDQMVPNSLGDQQQQLFGNDNGPNYTPDHSWPATQQVKIDSATLQESEPESDYGPLKKLSTILLQQLGGNPVATAVTYSFISPASVDALYVLAQFRDLRNESAEDLLDGSNTLKSSIAKGRELGQLCYEVCADFDKSLPDHAEAWIGLKNPQGPIEPIVTGTFSIEIVETVMQWLAQQPSAPNSTPEAFRRDLPITTLQNDLAQNFKDADVHSLWCEPLYGSDSELLGLIVLTNNTTTLEPEMQQKVMHTAEVMSCAVEQMAHPNASADSTSQDALTQLPNRKTIVERLNRLLEKMAEDDDAGQMVLSLLMVDLNRFRSINEARGVETGDAVLVEVARRLLGVVRMGDVVSRTSGDQFLVLCVAKRDELNSISVARRVLKSIAEPFRIEDDDSISVTASIGVVEVVTSGLSAAEVLGRAESALLQASLAGRGQYAMYSEGLRSEVADRYAIGQALPGAIKDDELVAYYQPLVEIKTGTMTGAEALVRWERPGYGLLGPGEFLPAAEELDLMVDIGNWMIDQVCSDLSRWPESRGRKPIVTVNLAAAQLTEGTLVTTVVSALRRHKLQPRCLGFEITESAEIVDMELATSTLNRLANLGCRVAIDDFGIGHATLSYLRQFSMAKALKLDRSFVLGLGNSREDTAIVNASAALAASLDLQVIAEGVEDLAVLPVLRDLGCRYAQGYALSRPVPFDEVLELWQKAQIVAATAA